MSLTIKPFEQIVAEFDTLIAIHLGAKNAADLSARAAVALQVAGIFSALGSGNVTTAQTVLQTLVTSVTKDPGTQQFVGDALQLGATLLQTQLAINAAVPLLGAAAQAVAANIAAGMTAIASLYPAAAAPAAT